MDSADLVRLASVTQLQMLFERTRADYLVTEPPNYSLRLMAVAPLTGSALPDLVDEGTNLVAWIVHATVCTCAYSTETARSWRINRKPE